MQIVINFHKPEHALNFFDDFCKAYGRYGSLAKRLHRARMEIELINGDYLKLACFKKNIDGMRADVAIGSYADEITRASIQEHRVWSFSDLDNYLTSM